MARKTEKKEKPTPKPCVCGKMAVIVKNEGGKMITCPDPLNCRGNLRTRWHRHEELAVTEWNGLVSSFLHTSR